MKVVKAGGEVEEFQINKLIESLTRSGASREEAEEIGNIIKERIPDYITTNLIYKYAKELLKKLNHSYASRYSLKKAMLRLGPSGYPFERFLANLLIFYDFETHVDVIEEGKCISHEIDVLAFKEDLVVAIECKYHSSPSRASDSKVAMYVNSRFKDLEEPLKKKYRKDKFEGWLVTNTRLTNEAKRFARCYNFRSIAWRYPEDGGLEKMIEKKHLFPITTLIGIKQNLLKTLLEHNIILVRHFLATDEDTLLSFGFEHRKIKDLKKQAQNLISSGR